MLNLPESQFRYFEVTNDHPLVQSALRQRKHYEPCWCNSGRKYKKCHAIRRYESELPTGQLLIEVEKIIWKTRGCMHPEASQANCSGKVIDAHSIQRKGPLKKIIDDTNHDLQFKVSRSNNGLELVKTGWRKASTFPGYCAKHDSQLFQALDTRAFIGDDEQCLLLAFRNLCNELYRKHALIDVNMFLRDVQDRGSSLNEQIDIQLSVTATIDNQLLAIQEFEDFRTKLETALAFKEYSLFESKCYFFKGDISVVSSSILSCGYDFNGGKLADLWDMSAKVNFLAHSIVDTPEGGAIVFIWLKGATSAQAVIDSFEKLDNDKKGDIFVQYCFLNSENTYFAAKWWHSLSLRSQNLIEKLSKSLSYDGGTFSANTPPLVSWGFSTETA
jgi:SEC-C motif